MASPAVKHMDPVIGVDVHTVAVGPVPEVPLPHPHVGFVLDLREYVDAAMGVIGSIVFTFVEDQAQSYLDDHPDAQAKLDRTIGAVADAAGDAQAAVISNPLGAGAARLAEGGLGAAGALGAGVGMGGAAGRPVFVNGFLRATAGTHTCHLPALHFPLGEAFTAPDPLPSNDAESYMGSRTVLANNDPMSFMALPAMSCWATGMEPPPHNGAHTKRIHLSMPSSVMLPIPGGRPVLVGGPPVMNMIAAGKGLFKAFRGSKWAHSLADKLRLKPGFLRCKVLRAEPVDVTTGEVVVQQCDFTVAGRLPLAWDRYYASHDTRGGAVGMRWRTPADIRLELVPHEGAFGAAAYFPDHATAYDVLPAADGWAAREYDWQHGHALYRVDDRLVLRTRGGVEYGFALPRDWEQTVAALRDDARLTLPVERIADLNGNAWVFERNQWGQLARIAEWTREGATARAIECATRDSALDRARGRADAGWLAALTLIDADGGAHPLVSYEYDGERNLRAAVDAMAHPHRFDYVDGHRMVAHTSARGVSFYYQYSVDEEGVWRVDRAWGDDGLFDYRFEYDRARMETCVIDSRGHTWVLQLNERGMPVAEIDPLGGVTSYRYDERGRANSKTDPAGHTSAWQYDRYGNLLAQTLPDASVIRSEYDAHHRPVRVTLPRDRQWHYAWDAHGNLLTQTTPSGATSTYTYDRFGQPSSHIGALGACTRFEYDRDGNLVAVTDALGRRKQYRHDASGYLVEAIDAIGQVSRYEYDHKGNLTRAIEPGGCETHCAYDADGNLVRHRDVAGAPTNMEYSALGQLTKRISPDGGVVEYRYDTEGQLTGLLNERGELYQFKRDPLGRITEEIDYWGQQRRYEYGKSGHLLRTVDALGRSIDFETDALGRVIRKHVPDPTQPGGLRTEVFCYDRSGNLVCAESHGHRIELAYDAAGRIVEERQGDAFSVTHAFDPAGNYLERKTRLVKGNREIEHVIRYGYDALGLLESIQVDDEPPVRIERDAAGLVCIERLDDRVRRELVYASDGKLASQTVRRTDGAAFASEYTYDAYGEMLARQDSRLGLDCFEYDRAGRIVAHRDPTGRLLQFPYDPTGNLLVTRMRDGVHLGGSGADPHSHGWIRDGELNGCRYVFDRVGNLIAKHDAQQEMTLCWDGDGLLLESTVRRHRDASANADRGAYVHTHYIYDAFHRRIGKTSRSRGRIDCSAEHGELEESLSTTSLYFWDGDVLTGEWSTETRTWREWFYYPATFVPLAVVEDNIRECEENVQCDPAVRLRTNDCERYWLNTEPNGAPTRVFDTLGNVVWEAGYGAWATVRQLASDKGFRQPLRLQGQYCDEETGFYYNRHRYFDPAHGGFISQDPLGIAAGTNAFAYGPNSLGWTDPLGLAAAKDSPHLLFAAIVRDNRVVHSDILESGGITAEEAADIKLRKASHTEPKFFEPILSKLRPGDTVLMRGVEDPCAAHCKRYLQIVAFSGHRVSYAASRSNEAWIFRRTTHGERGHIAIERRHFDNMTGAVGEIIKVDHFRVQFNGETNNPKICKI
ncbi:type IV secretion protein Rhs [Paraburkholderia sp. NMBU_R16]|uniref:RHS repeat-associated core domain-containing protein n=1 Tax=Paraburkholderia sp. NMBU_R16 TaxID=2698676 RepID=UPI001564B73D|nr:RHS repeat-associated core domain-containing protein [Paraburkholderia sp. NMBU_R16]NRO97450.1 type IV secretion protein Rhs [Paraburkholderia sp. NMBU_R16]